MQQNQGAAKRTAEDGGPYGIVRLINTKIVRTMSAPTGAFVILSAAKNLKSFPLLVYIPNRDPSLRSGWQTRFQKWTNRISITEHAVSSSGWDHSPEPSPFFILLFFLLLLYFVFRFFSGLLIGLYHTILFHPWPRFLSCTTSIMIFMLSFELFSPVNHYFVSFSYDRLFQLFHNLLYISLITGSNHFIGRFLLHDLLCK